MKQNTPHYIEIVEFLPDATFVIDSDRRVIAWNLALEEMTGVYKKDIMGKGDYAYSTPFYGMPRPILIDFIFGEDRKNEIPYKSVERKGNRIFAETFCPLLYNGKGAHLWGTASPLFDEKGNLIGAIESIRDITMHKQTEKDLRLSEERFSKAFRASPNPMSITLLANGVIIDVNDVFLETVGRTREDVISQRIYDVGFWLNPGEREKIVTQLSEGNGVRNKEIIFKKKSGELCNGLFSAEIIDINGMQCLLGIVTDITEKLRYDREMSRLDRLNLVGEMAATIAHEIRNPLTNILGFTEILKNEMPTAPNSVYFDFIVEELYHANSIVEEFLFLARSKPLTLKKQKLDIILKAIAPLIKASAIHERKEVDFELNEVAEIPLDEKEIRQLVLNLVRNGLEAMDSGGKLTIRIFMNQNDVVLAVHDQGSGIAADVLEKIGTPFFTTKEKGTGLGLAVCYSIAARHNADIKIKTGAKGTTFFVIFKQSYQTEN
ncbi:MAG: PAS domain S-box protein [Peptococcaceae bacterium]|nr:PAS domain-containing sensor histidine kinase [Pelotomaculum propionicicum]NLI11378.1 PAS domain S-box protein [Peptococcaceae bacterium]